MKLNISEILPRKTWKYSNATRTSNFIYEQSNKKDCFNEITQFMNDGENLDLYILPLGMHLSPNPPYGCSALKSVIYLMVFVVLVIYIFKFTYLYHKLRYKFHFRKLGLIL